MNSRLWLNPSPNLSPQRGEALTLAPLPYKGRGWGLGLKERCTPRLITNYELI
ncbi:hypothetical protein B6N60_00076 [Richelia sinica FACHB-800]|uniref:Uncharacterized protein n=1 Tax=Richelia sinica FACHB-800 TaxID=1357546 RepID=A0A975Y2U8_9NOST|nr:hypothetical protein B6N60_00076 [Richelia sinica FACHB-800]